MATQEGENVSVCSVKGNFDDAQTGVKRIFGDAAMAEKLNEKGYFFSSANSINWGRLVPQIVYYVSAYCDLITQGKIQNGEPMNVCVPTGNFGNIFAAYLAKRMGLPIAKFLCASNSNHILTDFLRTGVYDRNRPFYTTISPSMDILISSNLERLLYLLVGSEKTRAYMKALQETGRYEVDAETLCALQKEFCGYYADEAQTAKTIVTTYAEQGYLCDTHTAVGVFAAKEYRRESGDATPMVVASTASPYKFAVDVYGALRGEAFADEMEALAALAAYTKTAIPAPLAGLSKKEIRFDPEAAIEADAMADAVLAQLS
jgi:threonine synthase